MVPVQRSLTRWVCVALLCAQSMGGAMACAAPGDSFDNDPPGPSLEILALSRGRGVPESTWEAFQAIASRIDAARKTGEVADVERSVIGLEGETRLCVVFRDRAAYNDLGSRLREMGAGLDLLEIRDSACPKP
jgi:hypothetical protein